MASQGPDMVETGVSNLDRILGGGIIRRSLMMIIGAPGTGKTLLAEQIAFHGAARLPGALSHRPLRATRQAGRPQPGARFLRVRARRPGAAILQPARPDAGGGRSDGRRDRGHGAHPPGEAGRDRRLSKLTRLPGRRPRGVSLPLLRRRQPGHPRRDHDRRGRGRSGHSNPLPGIDPV